MQGGGSSGAAQGRAQLGRAQRKALNVLEISCGGRRVPIGTIPGFMAPGLGPRDLASSKGLPKALRAHINSTLFAKRRLASLLHGTPNHWACQAEVDPPKKAQSAALVACNHRCGWREGREAVNLRGWLGRHLRAGMLGGAGGAHTGAADCEPVTC